MSDKESLCRAFNKTNQMLMDEIESLRTRIAELTKDPKPALEKYQELTKNEVPDNPIERLRFYLSLALNSQDWLDVEPFIDALSAPSIEGWINVEDRLPANGQKIIGCNEANVLWNETYNENEPIGRMKYWLALPNQTKE